MLKQIYLVLKKIVIGAMLLYAFNLVAAFLNLTIPINIFTILVVSLLGIPGLCSLSLIVLFVL